MNDLQNNNLVSTKMDNEYREIDRAEKIENDKKHRKEINEEYCAILNDKYTNEELVKYMIGINNIDISLNEKLKRIRSGIDISTRKFSNDKYDWVFVPQDFYIGTSVDMEDDFIILYEAGHEKNIKDGVNTVLYKNIGDTQITYGQKEFAEGVIWNNALICYNSTTILIRSEDNHNGQPGLLRGLFSRDRLDMKIIEKYIIPDLIWNINRNYINKMSYPEDIMYNIKMRIIEIREKLLERLNHVNMTMEKLFIDAPVPEELCLYSETSVNVDSSRVIELERTVMILQDKLDDMAEKMKRLEDMIMSKE